MWMRIARYLLIAAVVFLVLCGVAALAVPLLVQHVALERAGESIGRQVSIERVRFNPFTLALSARGIRVAAQDASTDFVTIAEAKADFSISSVRYLAPVIDALTIIAPRIRLQRTQERRFNFSDIIERLRSSPAEQGPDDEPARFALHNLELSQGEIVVDDLVLEQQHRVAALTIGVPFVSNLDYAADITVEPALSAVVNGSPLTLTGASVPFSDTLPTSLDLVVSDLNIATYLPLVPTSLAFTVPKGKLDGDLKIGFLREAAVNKLTIAGMARVKDLQVDALEGPTLLSARRISLDLEQIEPLAGRYVFGELAIDGLDVSIERAADGGFALVDAFAFEQDERPAGADNAKPIQWAIRKTSLQHGRAAFTDKTVSPAVELVHTEVDIELAEIGNRQASPAAASLSLTQNESSQLSWQGRLDVSGASATGELSATVASIAPYLPYLAGAVKAKVHSGALAAQGRMDLDWTDGFTLEIADATASVEKARLELADEDEPALAFGRLAGQGISVSLAGRKATVARLALDEAEVRLERDAEGRFNLQRIVAAGEAAKGETASEEPAWTVKVDQIDLESGQLAWHDMTASKPVKLLLKNVGGRIGQVGTDLSVVSSLDLKASVGESGTATARGEFIMAPWSMKMALQLKQFALAGIDPYVAERLTLGIDEGSLSTSGQLQFGDDRVRYQGSLAVDGLRTRERATSTQAIRWNKLLLDGVDVDVNLQTLGPDDRITIGAITLSDFFARVLLSEKGRFNLQDIVRSEGPAQPDAPDRPGPVIRLGAIKLERGRSNFTDRFVQPNYSVNLTGLNGGISALASDKPAPADLVLKGRIDRDAPVEISGKINPLGPTLFADIRARAQGIDLPKLSPYSVKYIGYTIEKGQLSLDAHYRIEEQRLEAQNRVLLDQLTLGEKIDSADVTNLPVQLALGLLKNNDGEIDVNLPIEGSLNDPQFSIRGLIGRAIGNLLTRVVTAPFTALASAFGGGAELSFVEFEPGTAELTDESVKRLETISKALTERPALELEIAGRVDPKSENDAIKRQRLEARLRSLKRREAGGGEAASSSRDTSISKEEYPALLKRLYDNTKLPDKPRNVLGLAKSLEVAEMEKLLLDAIEVDEQTAGRLASRRAQAVQEWLATQGGISGDRMFTLAPRIGPDATGPNRSKPQCPAHCAEFSLR
jgi:uncharacterized protein involved in outer membrane biogenesis